MPTSIDSTRWASLSSPCAEGPRIFSRKSETSPSPPGGALSLRPSPALTARRRSWIARLLWHDYQGAIRQITITDLGHEEPTLLLTNQLKASPAKLIGRYARRMVIENNIQDGVDFFHMDALSSAVAMKVNCDVLLTVMASSLYRLLGAKVGAGLRDRQIEAHLSRLGQRHRLMWRLPKMRFRSTCKSEHIIRI